jgi:hypothetical protein
LTELPCMCGWTFYCVLLNFSSSVHNFLCRFGIPRFSDQTSRCNREVIFSGYSYQGKWALRVCFHIIFPVLHLNSTSYMHGLFFVLYWLELFWNNTGSKRCLTRMKSSVGIYLLGEKYDGSDKLIVPYWVTVSFSSIVFCPFLLFLFVNFDRFCFCKM